MIYIEENKKENTGAIAYRLLWHALHKEYGLSGDLMFGYGPNGKPYLKNHPHIFFNISHCRAGAACVVSDREVGIDMQDIRAFSERAARRVCTEKELKRIQAAPGQERLFCKLWAVKEAYVKWHGGSILGAVVDTEKVMDGTFLYEGADYWLCCFGCSLLA